MDINLGPFSVSNLTGKSVWDTLTGAKTGNNVSSAAIVAVLDLVLAHKSAEYAFSAMAIMNNTASMYKNTEGAYPTTRIMANVPLYTAIQSAGADLRRAVSPVADLIAKALIEPNVAGIPISTATIDTEREVEVSESQVIVQSEQTRKYWTDNAVPRLKTWSIQGYLTSMSPLDTGTLIKPSLQWQAYYLDVCSSSRRPVLFKTNRGEFVKVQITNLHTTEEASYNNAIKVDMHLKEYNPYFISDKTGDTIIAIKVGSGNIEL